MPVDLPGLSASNLLYWNYPRRWKLILCNLSMTNILADDLKYFLDFEFATNREEYRVDVTKSATARLS